ncbi:MAG: hypothetical protein ACE5KE_02460 [Methanosarcinales archaeon]
MMREVKEIRDIIKICGLKGYIKSRKLGLSKEEYWPEHKRILSVLYERLVEKDSTFLIGIEEPLLYPANKTLLEVVNSDMVFMPIKPVEKNKETSGKKELNEIELGRAWQVYLFDGKNILKDGELVTIDSGKPSGKGRFKVKIKKNAKSFYDSIYKNYDDEVVIAMGIKYVKNLFGNKDTEGEKVEKDKVGYFTYIIEKVSPPKIKSERAGN